MLRRRADNRYEFRVVEAMFQAGTPPPLTAARRDVLRLRIMSQLESQDAARSFLGGWLGNFSVGERWIVVPAGLGIAAAIVVATQLVESGSPGRGVVAHSSVPVSVDGIEGRDARAGQLIVAKSATWLAIGTDVRIGLDDNSAVRYNDAGGELRVSPEFGTVTVASTSRVVTVQRGALTARVAAQSTAQFFLVAGETRIEVAEGSVTATWAGTAYVLPKGTSATFGTDGARGVPGAGGESNNTGTTPDSGATPGERVAGSVAPGGGPAAVAPSDAAGATPATSANDDPSSTAHSGPSGGGSTAPGASEDPGGALDGVGSPGSAGDHGTPPAHSNPGGNAATEDTGPGNSHSGGVPTGSATPPANSNAGGNSGNAGTPPANSNAGGNSANAGTPPANSNAGGAPASADPPPSSSNAGGNSDHTNSPANSNAGGNADHSNNPANSNAGGNAGTPPDNSNAGGKSGKAPK